MEESDKLGDCDEHAHTTICKTDNQQGCIVAQRTLLKILW